MKRFLICLFFLFTFVTNINAQVTPEDIAKSLRKDLQHPYLYFTEQEKPAILERIENDPELKNIMERLLAECNRLLYTPVEKVLPRQLRDSRFDTSGKYLGEFGKYRHAMYTLAFVYQMTGDEKYARKAFEFAETLCDLDTWVIRACQFPKAYFRVSPWNVIDDKVVFSFAIMAADTATEMAAVYDWLYPALNKVQRDRIRGALLEKAIIQVRGNYDYHWWSTAYRCNWCGICFTGLGVPALALLTEDPHLVDVVAESYNRMTKMHDQLGVDGGWHEGRSYWAYGMRQCVFFMDAVKRLTNGKYNLFKHPRLRNNPASFALYGLTGYFGDGSGGVVGSTHMLNKLIEETHDGEAAWYRDNMLGAGNSLHDIIWPRSDVKPVEPGAMSMHFRAVDWAFMRSDFKNPETATIACKAGYNNDSHHGHLDVGQFMVNWRGQAFIRDLGSAKYDEKYFDAEKYDTPQASSRGHNLIFVNGEQQIPGKRFNKPLDETVGGNILEFRKSSDRDYVLMDPSNSYPGKELKKWRRHIILEKPVIIVVVDEVESHKKGAEIEARFHSACEQIIKDGYTLLDGSDGDMAIIPVIDGKFAFRPARHAYLALQKQARFQWIPYNGTVVHAPDNRTILAHIILPVDDEGEARAIVNSAERSLDSTGNLMLSFVKDGTTYLYNFKREKDGLVLE